MKTPFPGMDPYLEHPVLWTGFHARMIFALASKLRPLIRPRYVASIEERVYIEGPQMRRVPDLQISQRKGEFLQAGNMAVEPDNAVVMEVEEIEVHEKRVEILDLYNNSKLVALLEVLSPTNKRSGPGRDSYISKQKETLEKDCHLLEIDLLRDGTSAISLPTDKALALKPYDNVVCVSRWPFRKRYELYPRSLRERLPRIRVPLGESDPDVVLDIQNAFEFAHEEGDYVLRVRYDEPCEPPLSAEDQQWASQCWQAYKDEYPELFRQQVRNGSSPSEQK